MIIKKEVKQPSRTVFYILCTNKRATLTKASVYHPRSNSSGSKLNFERYVVSPRTVVDFVGAEPIEPTKKNFICGKTQLSSSILHFINDEQAIQWFRSKYSIIEGNLVIK